MQSFSRLIGRVAGLALASALWTDSIDLPPSETATKILTNNLQVTVGAFALGLAAARFLKSSGPESEYVGQVRSGSGTRSGMSVPSWPTEPLSGPGTSPGSTTVAGSTGSTGLPGATDWGETSREGPAFRR